MRWVENRIALPDPSAPAVCAPPAPRLPVQTAERLVHHNQIGIVQERGYQLNLLLHPLESSPSSYKLRRYLHPIRPIQCTPARLFGRQPVQLTEEDQLIQNLHLLVESALLGRYPPVPGSGARMASQIG